MQKFVNLICEKTDIDKDITLKNKIRGLPGFNFGELVLALISSTSLEETAKYLGYTVNPVKQAIRSTLGTKFPDRSRSFGIGCSCPIWRYTLLDYIGYKFCNSCEQIIHKSKFTLDSDNLNLLSAECGVCCTLRSKKQKEYIVQRTPSWSEEYEISILYKLCPKECVVDHIIPLRGKLVCGLHVINNLQYLSKKDNRIKSNNFIVE